MKFPVIPLRLVSQVLLVIGLLVAAILGGAVFLWFYAQKHADELGIKKKKKVRIVLSISLSARSSSPFARFPTRNCSENEPGILRSEAINQHKT